MIFIIIVFLNSNAIYCQTEDYDTNKRNLFFWYDEPCNYSGEYDTTLYTRKQLEGTLNLWLFHRHLTFNGGIPTLDKYYKIDKEYLQNQEVVNVEYFQNLKRARIQYLGELYKYERITMRARTDPWVLLDVDYGRRCKEYADLLNESDTNKILLTWKELYEKIDVAKNSNPGERRKEFLKQYNSSMRLIHARMFILNNCWWGCWNNDTEHDYSYTAVKEEFLKLFSKIDNNNCDEADP